MSKQPQLNNATNGEIALVKEWMQQTFLIPHRICDGDEMHRTAAELAHEIFGFIKENYTPKNP